MPLTQNISFTHNFFYDNWITFHYNLDKDQILRSSKWDVFNYSSSRGMVFYKDFQTELANTCKKIHEVTNQYENKLGLFLSGGLDSEIILRTYVRLGIEIELFFIKFKNNLNDHEYEYVRKIANQYNLKINHIEVDILNWFESGSYKDIVSKYKTFDLATPLQIYARDQIPVNYSIISGIYEPHMYQSWHDEDNMLTWIHLFEESPINSRINFCREKGFKDFPFFYLYRPELYAAYTFDPHVKEMIKNPYKLSLVSTKKLMMKKYFLEMEERPKFTGFENIPKELRLKYLGMIDHDFIDGSLRIKHTDIDRLFYNEE